MTKDGVESASDEPHSRALIGARGSLPSRDDDGIVVRAEKPVAHAQLRPPIPRREPRRLGLGTPCDLAE
jgi:hypothetical protein